MPELPEVETALRGVSPYLKDYMIEKIEVRQPKLRWAVSLELATLHQVKILDLTRRAKYLIIHTEKGYIIGHLGMSGTVRIVPHDSPIDKHDHLDIVLNNGRLLRYNDPRRFGAWLWTEKLDEFHLFLKLGPEPLSEEFNADYLFKKSRKKTTALKTFLMDNAVVVGVGNIYANESLFLCGLHPMKQAANLTRKQCERLVETIKSVLTKAIEQGGKRDAIDDVLVIMAEHKSLDYAMDRAKQEAKKAVDAIALLPESEYKKALISLAYLSVDRTY